MPDIDAYWPQIAPSKSFSEFNLKNYHFPVDASGFPIYKRRTGAFLRKVSRVRPSSSG